MKLCYFIPCYLREEKVSFGGFLCKVTLQKVEGILTEMKLNQWNGINTFSRRQNLFNNTVILPVSSSRTRENDVIFI